MHSSSRRTGRPCASGSADAGSWCCAAARGTAAPRPPSGSSRPAHRSAHRRSTNSTRASIWTGSSTSSTTSCSRPSRRVPRSCSVSQWTPRPSVVGSCVSSTASLLRPGADWSSPSAPTSDSPTRTRWAIWWSCQEALTSGRSWSGISNGGSPTAGLSYRRPSTRWTTSSTASCPRSTPANVLRSSPSSSAKISSRRRRDRATGTHPCTHGPP